MAIILDGSDAIGDLGDALDAKPDYVAWQDYTPTLGNLTVGNGTAVWRYAQVEKIVFVSWSFTFGSTSSIGSTPNVSLPVTAARHGWSASGRINDTGTANYGGGMFTVFGTYSYANIYAMSTAGTYSNFTGISSVIPMTWGVGDNFNFNFSYEVAA